MRRRKTDFSILFVLLIGGALWLIINAPVLLIVVAVVIVGVILSRLIGTNQRVGFPRDLPLASVDSMDGITFEHYVVDILKKNGYSNVKATKASGDFGCDVVAYKKGKKYVIQCKRSDRTIGVSAIQQVFSARHYYNASNAAVITNNLFSQPAIKLAKSSSVELWDRNTLNHLMRIAENKKFVINWDIIKAFLIIITIVVLGILAINLVESNQSSSNGNNSSSYVGTSYSNTVIPTANKTIPITASPTMKPADTPMPTYITATVKDYVNIREKDTVDSKKLGGANKGDTLIVTIPYYSMRWHQIYYNDRIAYVSALYCNLNTDIPSPTPSPTPTPRPTATPKPKRGDSRAYPIIISSQQLAKAIASDYVSAQSKYEGKYLQVTGKIVMYHRGVMNGPNTYTITNNDVIYYFNRTYSSSIKVDVRIDMTNVDIIYGQNYTITVLGYCDSITEDEVVINHATYVEE